MAEPLTFMTVHAHPDDEAIGTGGVLARYADEGLRTVLVTCTGGEVGEIAHPDLATPDNLGEVRRRELAAANAPCGCWIRRPRVSCRAAWRRCRSDEPPAPSTPVVARGHSSSGVLG